MFRWINRHSEYLEFRQAHQIIRTTFFTVLVIYAQDSAFAYGTTVSHRVGNAVNRNLIRRRIKAWFRQNTFELQAGMKINLIAKGSISKISWEQLSTELSEIISNLKKLSNP